ncbi:hypothetical protein ACKWTF_015717 [Chironomus riparius]
MMEENKLFRKKTFNPKRDPFRTIFKIFNQLGYWNKIPKWQNRLANGLKFMCLIMYSLDLILPIFYANDLTNVLNFIIILPVCSMVCVSAFDFMWKKAKIRKFLELVEEIEVENPDAKHYFDDGYGFFKKIFMAEIIALVFLLIPFVVTPVIMHKLPFESFIPDIIKDYKATSYVYWTLKSISGIYDATIYTLVSEVRSGFLIIANFYMQYFRYKLKTLHASKENLKEAKEQLVGCIRMHQDIQK